MVAGLQIYGPTGALKLDLSDRAPRWLAIYYIDLGVDGFFVHDGILTGTPFCAAHMVSSGGSSWETNNLFPPGISFSGNVMYYTRTNAPHRLLLWVY